MMIAKKTINPPTPAATATINATLSPVRMQQSSANSVAMEYGSYTGNFETVCKHSLDSIMTE